MHIILLGLQFLQNESSEKPPENFMGGGATASWALQGKQVSTSGIFVASKLATAYSFQCYQPERPESHPDFKVMIEKTWNQRPSIFLITYDTKKALLGFVCPNHA